jgi:hypothetical protein
MEQTLEELLVQFQHLKPLLNYFSVDAPNRIDGSTGWHCCLCVPEVHSRGNATPKQAVLSAVKKLDTL